ncbi:superoxide dismutase family protein [Robbsia sp. Bb-Pol-6]|uniref:Superoxide dismutase family protein n=1 Tax=Robbsia betulipollinis TaxID=2981849 RepID=A0ABT3ZNB0_9BURK|nr:superoxide dismutase family protein [Robbsia betulipollinis]MCY0387453.1 superoxide dismutase family protein [Robbsia betulipollinis]
MQLGNWWGRAGRRHAAAWLTGAALSGCAILGPHERHAGAMLRPLDGSSVEGRVALAERVEGLQLTYDIVGLAPNTQHTVVIHAGGDCGGQGARDIGMRLTAGDVLPPGAGAPARYSPRLTRIWADGNGVAMGFFVLPGLTLDGVRSVVGRTLVIHSGVDEWDEADDAASDPSASANDDHAGRVLACGVIAR